MMRIISCGASSFALCLVVVIAGCASRIELDVDKTADFSSFGSFSVNSAEIPANHQSLQRHVDTAIAMQLTSKGMKRTSADDAAVNIRYFLTLDDASSATKDDDAETKAPSELIVDVQDSVTGEVIWRSRSEREIPVVKSDESVMAESVQEWVNDLLEEYPGTR
jgi:hypothetical protein